MTTVMRTLSESDRQLISDSHIFQGVGIDDMWHLFEECEVIDVPESTTVIQPNTSNEYLYIVLAGALHVYLDESLSTHFVTLRPGECAGELSVIDGSGASALVITSKDSRLMRLNQENLWRLVKASHGVARNLLYILSKRMRNDNRAIISGMRLQQELEHAASIDGLTGLFNRRWMNDSFKRQITRALQDEKPLALLLADLDHFKRVNDTYGHVAGDQVLCSAAMVLSKQIRPSDSLVRLGGEEFALILPDTMAEEAMLIAERMRSAMEKTLIQLDEESHALEIQVTVSLGVALLMQGDNLKSLLSRADSALYRAKNNGRNRIESN